MLFWLISSAEVATPPALAGLAGRKQNAVFLEILGGLQGGGHVGALCHSDSTPFATSAFASSSSSSFCVAQGRAMSHFTRPDALALVVLGVRTVLRVLGQAGTLDFLDLLDRQSRSMPSGS